MWIIIKPIYYFNTYEYNRIYNSSFPVYGCFRWINRMWGFYSVKIAHWHPSGCSLTSYLPLSIRSVSLCPYLYISGSEREKLSHRQDDVSERRYQRSDPADIIRVSRACSHGGGIRRVQRSLRVQHQHRWVCRWSVFSITNRTLMEC